MRIKEVFIESQQRRVRCRDIEVIQFLQDAMRQDSARGDDSGVVYDVSIYFDHIGTCSTVIYLNESGFSISVPQAAAEEGFPTHQIYLRKPLPPKMEKLLNFLNEPCDKVKGDVLVFETGKAPYVDRDPSLIAK